ncbi:MAG: hypothetical protein AAF456_25660, partial [Planctomycetota bacterium]
RERLAASDPGNASWQRDLAVSHSKIAQLAEKVEIQPAAMEAYKKCFDVLQGMKDRNLHFDPALEGYYQMLKEGFGSENSE